MLCVDVYIYICTISIDTVYILYMMKYMITDVFCNCIVSNGYHDSTWKRTIGSILLYRIYM